MGSGCRASPLRLALRFRGLAKCADVGSQIFGEDLRLGRGLCDEAQMGSGSVDGFP